MDIKKNKGYSLVEMIIVLAIVVILAGLALVSLTLVNTARAKDASNKFSSEVNQVRKKAIEMKPAKGSDPYFDETKDYRYGLVLYLDDGKYQTDQVVVEKNAAGQTVAVVLYDAGHRFTNGGNFKYRVELNNGNLRSLGDYGNRWVGINMNLTQDSYTTVS